VQQGGLDGRRGRLIQPAQEQVAVQQMQRLAAVAQECRRCIPLQLVGMDDAAVESGGLEAPLQVAEFAELGVVAPAQQADRSRRCAAPANMQFHQHIQQGLGVGAVGGNQ
jgi:hypothetical protein